MRTTIGMLILVLGGFCIIPSMTAQTKKIAWRSHGGDNVTFTFELPDEFGRVTPSVYEETSKVIKQDSSTFQDSLATCKPPATIQLLPATSTVHKKKKLERRKQRKKAHKRQPKQKNTTLKDTSTATKKTIMLRSKASMLPVVKEGATQWLWLLLLPLVLVFTISLKNP